MVGHTVQYWPPYWQHCHTQPYVLWSLELSKSPKILWSLLILLLLCVAQQRAYLKDTLFSCEGNGVNVMSCPVNERVSSSIPSPYICCETYWEAISIWLNIFHQLLLDGGKHFRDHLFSKILVWWNSIPWINNYSKVIIPQILVFLHFSQCKLAHISFLSLYLIFFSLLIGFLF